MKLLWVLLCLTFISTDVFAQQFKKRILTTLEYKQLVHYSDSITNQLKLYYKLELKEQQPGKYQPERIGYIRGYLWLFTYLEQQLEVVSFSSNQIKRILGTPDLSYQEDGYDVFEYTWANRNYLKLKNLKYHFVFKNNELVYISKK